MRQYLGSRRGNYMMTMPFFIPVLVGFAALSIDISYINMSHTQAQHVADAASHAALVGYRATNQTSTGDAAAQWIIDNNKVGNGPAKLAQPIEYGEWDFSSMTLDTSSQYINGARAQIARNKINSNALDLFFAPILGYPEADITTMGVTAGRTRQIMLVQDVSCSFGGNDIKNSRDANVAFLDYLDAHPYPRDMIGMTLFGGRAWYPPVYNLSLVETHYSAMRNEFLAVDICSAMPSYMHGTPDPHCSTTQARGIILAREQFQKFGDPREFKAIVIISDGEPNVGLKSGENNGSSMSIRAANQVWGRDKDDNDMRTWNYEAYGCRDKNDPVHPNYLDGATGSSKCQNRWDYTFFEGDVHMWSVFFNEGGGNENWMKNNMVKGLGRPYATTDSDELSQIMVEIASSIPVVLTD